MYNDIIHSMNTKLIIKNACCEGCKASIEKHTKDIVGLKSLNLDLETKTALVDHDDTLKIEDVIIKIGSIGKGNYKASLLQKN